MNRIAALGLLLMLALPLAADETSDAEELARFDRRIKQEDRDHWAFRPVRAPAPPHVRDATWVRTPVDHFILARLEAKGGGPPPRRNQGPCYGASTST